MTDSNLPTRATFVASASLLAAAASSQVVLAAMGVDLQNGREFHRLGRQRR